MVVVIATESDAERAALDDSPLVAGLRAQTWAHWSLAGDWRAALDGAHAAGQHVLVADPAARLVPTALETMVWHLDANPGCGFVAGRLAGAGAAGPAPFCDALATAALFSSGALSALDPAHPLGKRPLALALAATVVGRAPGTQLQEPLAALDDPRPVAAAVRHWTAQGLTDALFGGTGRDPVVSALPIQSIDERPALATHHRPPAGGRRLLFVLQGWVMGGYTAFNTDLIPRLVQAGHQVTVCTTEFWRTNTGLDRVLAATPDVFHLPGFLPPEQWPRFVAGLVDSRAIDAVVVSHSMAGYHFVPWLRRRCPGVAVLDYVHTDWFEEQMYGSYAATSAAFADELDGQMASSATLAAQLVEAGAERSGVHVCHINIDPDEWRRDRYHSPANAAALRAGRAGPVILFAGRTAPEKRPLLAVRVLARLASSGVPFTFAVAGGGPLLVAMAEAARMAGIADRCVFLGELTAEQMRVAYATSDIYFAPSAIEGVARTLYEAMAMECVPVVADVGGQRELVVDGVGAIVAHGEGEEAAYVAALHALCTDPAARRRAAAAARARIVHRFSAARCVATFTAAADAAIARRATRADLPGTEAAARRTAVLGLELSRRNYRRHVPNG